MSRPLMIHIETINYCNHNCIFCAYQYQTSKKTVMPLSIFQKVTLDYANIGGGMISLTPSPGEVFLDNLLLERIKIIEKMPQITGLSVTTNGIGSEKWEDEDLYYILKKLKRVYVSIYGLDSDEYSKITQCNTYERCISSIRRIVDLSPTENIVFGFRLLKNRTSDEIDSWINKNFSKKIPFQYMTVYTTWGSLLDQELPILSDDAEWKKMPKITNPCFRPLISIKICVNGDVSLCVCSDSSAKDLLLGSVIDRSLESLFNSKKCKEFWDSDKNIPDSCKKCSTYMPVDELQPDWIEDPIDYIGG
ncbi:radical SAM/SPASM domain-containing protein [Methanomicrobium sp. W14]|uniref:radical SAM/SPASM domain-containing protein n=1 Tax=Methanomicrobium sp. W14 TaxID=2817839 RepID=UPI001AE30FB5|nr:radical SAM/SPASM domain-containing protein [Methanomicrobium sp. W14]